LKGNECCTLGVFQVTLFCPGPRQQSKLRLECGPDPVAARPSAVAARAVHILRYHHWRQPKLFIVRDTDSGSKGLPLREHHLYETPTSSGSKGCPLYETPTAAAGVVRYEKHQPTAKAVDRRRRRKLSTAEGGRRRQPATVERRRRQLSTTGGDRRRKLSTAGGHRRRRRQLTFGRRPAAAIAVDRKRRRS
jgi:hypothetical protein